MTIMAQVQIWYSVHAANSPHQQLHALQRKSSEMFSAIYET